MSSTAGEGTLHENQQIGDYRIVGTAQMGGMAEVYRVVDAQSCPFALKVMRLDRLDASAWLRFDRESKILAHLKGSSSVVWLLDRGELADGRPYVVMPYVEGASLRDIVELGHPSPHDCLRIARGMAQALVCIHARGIVHRDFNPQNILVNRHSGEVTLCDFGISDFASPPDPTNLSPRRITAPHPMRASLGTQGFIAPEQAQGNIAATPADLWSLGCDLLFMLTGTAPTDAQLYRRQYPNPPNDPLLRAIFHLALACLHPDPPNRITASQLLDTLDHLTPLDAPQVPFAERETHRVHTQKAALAPDLEPQPSDVDADDAFDREPDPSDPDAAFDRDGEPELELNRDADPELEPDLDPEPELDRGAELETELNSDPELLFRRPLDVEAIEPANEAHRSDKPNTTDRIDAPALLPHPVTERTITTPEPELLDNPEHFDEPFKPVRRRTLPWIVAGMLGLIAGAVALMWPRVEYAETLDPEIKQSSSVVSLPSLSLNALAESPHSIEHDDSQSVNEKSSHSRNSTHSTRQMDVVNSAESRPRRRIRKVTPEVTGQHIDCASIRSQADAAETEWNWAEILKLTKGNGRCWTKRGQYDRLRIIALSHLGRYRECINLGRRSASPEVQQYGQSCEKRLEQ